MSVFLDHYRYVLKAVGFAHKLCFRRSFIVVMLAIGSAVWFRGCVGGEYDYDVTNAVRTVECLQSTVDLGTLDVEAPLTRHALFQLRNSAKESMAIRSITTSCGCLVAEDYEQSIPPLGSSEVSMKLVVAPKPGPFERRAIVRFSSELVSPVQLTVVGSVAASNHLMAYPKVVHFGDILLPNSYGTPLENRLVKEVVVSRYDGEAFAVGRVESMVPWLNANCCEESKLRAIRHKIQLCIDPIVASAGQFSATVVVEEEGAGNPLSVKVLGQVHGTQALFKKSLVISKLQSGFPKLLNILSSFGNAILDDFTSIGVALDGFSGVTASMHLGQDGVPQILVEANSDTGPSPVTGTLIIDSGVETERVAIPLTIFR